MKFRFRLLLVVAAVLSATFASAQTKWHPGHYMRTNLERVDQTVSDTILNSIANEPAVVGVAIPYNWAVLEGPTPGSYDFSRIDHQLAVLSAIGKRLIVDVWDHEFTSTWTSFHSNVLPAYLNAPEYGGGWAPMTTGGCSKIWLQPVMDRYIALFQAMAARYDGNPYFEMASGGETARGINPNPADYSQEAYVTQWVRWAAATRAAWPNTNLWLGTNFFAYGGSDASLAAIISACYDHRIAVGGPDIRINSATPTPGVKITNGLTGSLGDLRGKIALRTDHQVLVNSSDTMELLYDNAVVQTNGNALKLNYVIWLRKKGANIPDDWDDDVLPFLRAHPDTIATVPSSYGTTAPAAPSGLTAMTFSSTQISLAWTDNSSNESGFVVERAEDAGFTSGLVAITAAANATTFASTGLSASTPYYFRVRAVNGAGVSPNSDAASATTATPGAIEPEINVRGHGVSIADGDTAPDIADDTNFGTTLTGGALSRTFTIQNIGSAPLAVGTPTVSGLNSADFTITAQPATTVAVGASTTFTVQFAPAVSGERTAAVTIPNGDTDENPYNFTIKGTGATTTQFELENYYFSKSAGDPHFIRVSPDDVLIQANADGDFLLFEIPGVPAGLCNIKVIVQAGPARAIFQLESSEAPGGPFTPHGSPIDTYASGNYVNNVVKAVATDVMFPTSGTRYFRFRITGRHPLSTARNLALDALQLARPSATIALTNLSQTYDGTAKTPTFTTSPAGLAVSATYNGESAAVNAGTYAVAATIADPNYVGSASGTLTILPGAATATLNDLAQTYDGTPRVVTVATTPVDVGTTVTYDGSETPPTAAGSYAVVATISDSNYVGDAVSGTLTVAKATAAISLGSLQATFDGASHAATVTTTPAGLAVSVTYDGSSAAPTAAGSYTVVVTVNDANYAGTALGTLTIAKRAVSLELADLRQAYNGEPHAVTATTTPDGLTVTVTYNGSATPPTNPGSYAVEAMIVDANNSGTASATLVITVTALVRHAPNLNGDIDGSMQVLLGEGFALNGGAMVSGDILVPGMPTVQQNGHPTYGGTLDGDGNASPSNYQVTLNGNVVLRHLVRRTDPIAMPTVVAPPSPTGTRNVSINSAGQGAGDFATLRNLTLNGNVGQFAIPAGTYGTFTANGSSGFTLGVAGATTPAVYNLQGLALNGTSRLEVVGPVIVNLANGVSLNGNVGDSGHPEWLVFRVASGGVTLNGNVTFAGEVIAPNGTVTINGNSVLDGSVACDRLTINGNGLLNEP